MGWCLETCSRPAALLAAAWGAAQRAPAAQSGSSDAGESFYELLLQRLGANDTDVPRGPSTGLQVRSRTCKHRRLQSMGTGHSVCAFSSSRRALVKCASAVQLNYNLFNK